MKNLEFVSHTPELLCGIFKQEWENEKPNYHFLGAPLDISSTYRTGARHAPDYFRKILASDNFECVTETGIDLKQFYRIKDWGNVGTINTNIEKSLSLISEGVTDLIGFKLPFIIFGGDHSVTIGIGKAFEDSEISFYPIYIDAHLDLYSDVMETKFSHACTLRRLSEMRGFQGATVLGYRDFTKDQLRYADKKNITTISLNELVQHSDLYELGFELAQNLAEEYGFLHISVDIDILDPSFAPGVGNPVACGLSTRELIWLIRGLFQGVTKSKTVSWDIVEYNPLFDSSDITAFAILKVLIEGLGGQISNMKSS